MPSTATKPAQRKLLGYASQGAVRQHGGQLPVYACTTCGNELCFPTSKRTGRKYAVNVRRSYHDARYYMGNDVHDCKRVMADRASWHARQAAVQARDWGAEARVLADKATAEGRDPMKCPAIAALFAEQQRVLSGALLCHDCGDEFHPGDTGATTCPRCVRGA
jgi:DNA-directed RNA polymerase subunit RPC12/RpoP